VRSSGVAIGATVIISAVLTTVTIAPLAAQQPSFRSGVDVVVIDVTVVDRTASPVGDLKPSDFIVTVDGKPRRILSAQFQSHRAAGIDEILRAERGEPQPDVIDPQRVGTGRDIIIGVDEDSLEPGDGLLAKRAIGRFLDHLLPTDRVAIVTLPRLPLRIGLTSDRRDLFDALSRVSPAVVTPRWDYQVGLSEAFEIARRDGVTANDVVQRECVDKLTVQATRTDLPANQEIEACRANVLVQANQMAMMGHDRAQRSLDALRRLAGLLSSIPRPKTLVLVTGGFPPPIIATEFTPVALALAAAQVNLYSLYLERDQAGAGVSQPSPTEADDEMMSRSGIENVTGAAGGTMLLVTGEFEPAFDIVSRELAGSYLLGVEVEPADRDGNPHRVDVRVGRPGVSIRSRRQYVIGSPRATSRAAAGPASGAEPATAGPGNARPAPGFSELSSNRILTAARDLEGTGDIYITLEVEAAKAEGPGGSDVLVHATIDPRSVSFAPIDGRRVAHLGVAIFCGDAKHALLGQLWQEVNLALKDDTFAKYSGGGIPYSAHLKVVGKPRDVKIVVYDFRSDLLGAMTAKVR
jgi:VWFA-related protein